MSTFVISRELWNQLRELDESVELCDPEGRVVGEFAPKADSADWEAIGPELSNAELLARVHSTERTYSTVEVLDHLRRLP